MAGLGRRSHYRKHLTDSVLHELPEPDTAQGDRISKVVATRGGNMFEVIVALSPGKTEADRQPQLAILPTKFNKLVWVKRNDFVICRTGQEESNEQTSETTNSKDQSNNTAAGTGGGIRYIITHILYKDQVKHLKTEKLWPFHDDEFITVEETTTENDTGGARSTKQDPKPISSNGENDDLEDPQIGETDDGIVYDVVNDDEYFLNTNRIKNMKLQDDSSDESESSSDEE